VRPWLRLVVAFAAFGAYLAGASARTVPATTPLVPPLVFEANRGQADAQAQFVAHGPGYTASLSGGTAVLGFGRAVLRLEPVGGNAAARAVGDDDHPGVAHYVRGASLDERISAPTYRRVRYADVYPGIDLVYHGRSRRLEYDFVVAPGADPGRIRLAVEGAERVEVDAHADLVVHTAAGDLRQPRPVAYQEVAGTRRRVDADYLLDGEGRVHFRLGAYDPSRRLVIDPVIAFATYLGGTNDDAEEYFRGIVRVAVDGGGNVYLTGTTRSPDFPTTLGADRTLNGDVDIFVTKLSPTGDFVYSTYLGGPCEDYARGIAVDAAGNAYVTGRVHAGMCYLDPSGGALVAKLDPNGNLVYATRLGGSLADSSIGRAIAVDADGHAYVTGVASTASHDFPVTDGAYRTTECANAIPIAGDGFVAELSADGSTLLYSTFLCGSGDDLPEAIAVDGSGNAYVAGTTGSSDFPTVHPIQTTRGGGPVGLTGFVSKLSPDGAALFYSTFFGGAGNTAITAIALDAGRNAYVTGETDSTDFPTTPGVLQERPGKRLCIDGCTDAFVTKIAASGSALVYSTYLYGELDDSGEAIAVDGAGNAYVVGTTVSLYFPILAAFQHENRGLADAFVAKLSPDATRLVYSSYLGGRRFGSSAANGWDQGTGVALDAAGNAYLAGYTQSLDLPTTPGAAQPNLAAGTCDVFGTVCGDGFVARITAGGPGLTPAVNLTVSPATAPPGGTLTATWAGIPTPTSSDYLRLFALGSAGDEFDDVQIYWPTTGRAGGTLSLALPAGLAPGWYELRLLSPDPSFSNLPTAIARSEPIRIDGAPTMATTTTTLPPATSCADGGGAACDDGDPCTVDECVPGVGCVASPVSGFAGVTCVCERDVPAACAGTHLPGSISGRRARACGLLDAAGTTDRTQARKRLRRALKMVAKTIQTVARTPRKRVPASCAQALKADLRDARTRAAGWLKALAGG
jgi:hypothetical protein